MKTNETIKAMNAELLGPDSPDSEAALLLMSATTNADATVDDEDSEEWATVLIGSLECLLLEAGSETRAFFREKFNIYP
jgi:hypothetical protein